jgi:hypothetical protein
MNKLLRVLASVRMFSSPLDLLKAGFTVAEVKEAIITILQPYFENQSILKELAVSVLVPEAMSLTRLEQHPLAFSGYRRCLDIYRSAHAVGGSDSLKSCASWEKDIQKGLSQYWSSFQLESSLSSLELEEFALESLRTIGMLIEANIKPHLKDLLNQVRIIERRPDPRANLSGMGLGDIVGKFISRGDLSELLAPPPWHIRLNQWRNIAQHNSFHIENDIIVCQYGVEPRVSKIYLTRNELKRVTDSIFNIFSALKLARTVFCVDNLENLERFISEGALNLRAEQVVLNFVSAVATQGFEVIDIRLTDEAATAILQDVTDQDPDRRRFHASQLVYQLWNCTGRSRVTIEYMEKDGTRSLISTVLGEDCERLTQGHINLEKFVKRIEFNDLKLGGIILADDEA